MMQAHVSKATANIPPNLFDTILPNTGTPKESFMSTSRWAWAGLTVTYGQKKTKWKIRALSTS